MLRTARGSNDGNVVETFVAGREYQVSDGLYARFVDEAKVAVAAAAFRAPEDKDAGPAPENKAPRRARSRRTRPRAAPRDTRHATRILS